MNDQARAGLCATCRHVAPVTSDRGAVFYRCDYARIDPSFRKYPVLPVVRCRAYAPASRPPALVSWSGGKDACVALHRARAQYDIVAALTMMDERGTRSRSHGLRADVLQAQVQAMGLRWITRPCGWDDYEARFIDALHEAREAGIRALVCGDILHPEHRQWVERVCAAAALDAVEPIFGRPTIEVYHEFLAMGGDAYIVAAEARHLDEGWLFRRLDHQAAEDLIRLGLDPCGENGEYHTLVTNCPAFAHPVTVSPGPHVLTRGYWAVDVQLA
jgi:uncharacterized protein (TIGR00290 family)